MPSMIVFSVSGKEGRLREGGLRNAGPEILAAQLGDDVVEVVLRAQALPFEHFHNRGCSPHRENGGLLDGQVSACRYLAHSPYRFRHSHGGTGGADQPTSLSVPLALRALTRSAPYPQTHTSDTTTTSLA